MKPIDLHSPRWVCFGDPERTIVVAFVGGSWVQPTSSATGDGACFVHAPIAGVIGAWMLASQAFVASCLGLVYRWDREATGQGRWTVLEAPFLVGKARATVWSEGARLFVDDASQTYERLGDGWVPRPILLPHVRFATRDQDGLILGTATSIHRVNLERGDDELLHAAGDRPGEGRSILDVCVARGGGLYVIDDAGTLVHVGRAGRSEVRHLGHYDRSSRHQYPDPEPSAVVDIDARATLLPSGMALSMRRGHGRLLDASGPRPVSALDAFRPLVPGLGAAPSVDIEGFDGGELLVRTGGVLESVNLVVPPGALRRTMRTADVKGEVFHLESEAVRVETPSETLRVPLATAPSWLLEEWHSDRAPMVLDVEGGLHRFDGVRYERIASARAHQPARYARGVDANLFLASDSFLWSVPIPEAASGREERALTDPELLEALLAAAPRDFLVRRLPIEQARVSSQLSGLREVGRVAAGIHLSALIGGAEAEAGLAARVMAGLGSRTLFRVFEFDGALQGWIAAEVQRCLVVVDERFHERLLALAAPA